MKMKIGNYNYQIYTHDNEVLAVSTYAGRYVKGKAKCDPKDEYSKEHGIKLAVARCDEKIAKKRVKAAFAEVQVLTEMLRDINSMLDDAEAFYMNAKKIEKTASDVLETVLKNS